MIGLPYAQLTAINKNAASSEATRYYLNGVCVQVTEGRGWMVATDGAVLLCCPVIVPPDTADMSVIIPSAQIAALKKSRSDDTVKMTLGPDRAFTFEYGDQIIGGKLIDGTFPDWRRVIPAEGYKMSPAPFDGEVTARLQKAAKAVTGGWAVVCPNGQNPAYVRYAGDVMFGVVMPLNTNNKTVADLYSPVRAEWM